MSARRVFSAVAFVVPLAWLYLLVTVFRPESAWVWWLSMVAACLSGAVFGLLSLFAASANQNANLTVWLRRIAVVLGLLPVLILMLGGREQEKPSATDDAAETGSGDVVSPEEPEDVPLTPEEVAFAVQNFSIDPLHHGCQPMTLDNIVVDRASPELTQYVAGLGFAQGFTLRVTKGNTAVLQLSSLYIVSSSVDEERSLWETTLSTPQKFPVTGTDGLVQIRRRDICKPDHEDRLLKLKIESVTDPPNTAIIRTQRDCLNPCTSPLLYWGVVPGGITDSGRPLKVDGHIAFVRLGEAGGGHTLMPDEAFANVTAVPRVWVSTAVYTDLGFLDQLNAEEPFLMNAPIWDIRGHDLGETRHLFIRLPPTWPPTRVVVNWRIR